MSGGIACAGDMAHFNCTADANPPATFVLYENEATIDEAMPGVWVRAVTSMRDYLHYRCVANNSLSSGASNNLTLKVHGECGLSLLCELMHRDIHQAVLLWLIKIIVNY